MSINKKGIALYVILGLSCLYWVAYYINVSTGLPKDNYSKNTFEGVHLNKYSDYLGVKGSLNIQHQYAPFLSQATKKISELQGTLYFSNDVFSPDLLNLDRTKYVTTKLDSSITNDYLFGLERTFRFKSSVSEKAPFLRSIINEPVILISNSNSVKYYGRISKATSEYIEVSASLPLYTSIDEIVIAGEDNTKLESFNVLLGADRLGLVRGGEVTAFNDDKQHVYVRSLPGGTGKVIYKNSQIIINNKTFIIKDVLRLNQSEYFLTIDGDEPYIPYFDSRKSIVKIIPSIRKHREVVFQVSQVTDKDYIYGKSRYFNLKLNDVSNITPKSDLILEDSKITLSIAAVDFDTNVVSVDLTRTLKYLLLNKVNKVNKVNKDNESNNWWGYIYEEKEDFDFERWISEGIPLEVLSEVNTELFEPTTIWTRGANINVHYYSEYKDLDSFEFSERVPLDLDFDIWEIYPGSILNLYYGKSNPAPTEMMIHVLGSDARNEYYKAFNNIKPKYISFAKPERFTPWLLNWHWTFFNEMIHNYDPVVDLDEFSLWLRANSNPKTLSTHSDFYKVGDTLPLSVNVGTQGEYSLYTVKVEYEVNNPLKSIPILGKSPRYLIEKSTKNFRLPVSLPWSETEWHFPLMVTGEEDVELKLHVMSDFLKSSSIEIKGIYLKKENVASERIKSLFLDFHSMK